MEAGEGDGGYCDPSRTGRPHQHGAPGTAITDNSNQKTTANTPELYFILSVHNEHLLSFGQVWAFLSVPGIEYSG